MKSTESLSVIIDQINSILGQIDDKSYAMPLEIFHGSSIGSHIRHIYDFYNCVVNSASVGLLDYNCRERNASIANHIAEADYAMKTLYDRIRLLDESTELNVVTDFSEDETIHRTQVISSVGRELMYAYDHAVHHLAIIKMGVRSVFPEVEISDTIGVAPSTLKHQSVENKNTF